MKQTLLRYLYRKNRFLFHSLFIEEYLSDVPTSITEPAMEWLAKGKEKLEKWITYQTYHIQRRLVTDAKDVETTRGMIFALRLLMYRVHSTTPQIIEEKRTQETEKKDFVEEVKGAMNELKKLVNQRKK